MYKKIYLPTVVTMLVLGALSLSIASPIAHAQSISDEDIHEQKLVVMYETIQTIQEQIKLIQMTYIQRLELRIDSLQARLNA